MFIPSAGQILAAVDDGMRLWPHNAEVIEDAQVERAVLAALSTPFEFGNDGLSDMPDVTAQTLLVTCKKDNVVIPLLDALLSITYMHAPCDRCCRPVDPARRLWVNCGASVVEVACCARCAGELEQLFPSIVWK